MEKEIIPQQGFKYIGLDVETFSGNIFNKIKSLFSILRSKRKCSSYLRDYDIAIGFGNYISLPVILSALDLGLKTIIHEQNSFAGKANKFLDKKVDLVIGSYEENRKEFKNPNLLILGNPQGSNALKTLQSKNILTDIGLNPNKKTVIIFMGSLGSQTVNKIILDFFDLLNGDYQVVYATGEQNYNYVIEKMPNKQFIKCFKIIDAVSFMKNATLIVSRAGATTISEICAIGIPSILIPSPFVPNNHQFYNAKSLVDKDAAIMIEEKDLDSSLLCKTINSIINDDNTLSKLSRNALSLGKPSSLDDIIKEIDKL